MSFLQLLEAIRTVTKANIVGADLNELAPTLDRSDKFPPGSDHYRCLIL